MRKRTKSYRKMKKNTATPRKRRIFRKPIRSSQQDIPIKDIVNGIVVTTDGRYIKIMEVKPTQLFNKPVEDRNRTLREFFSMMKIMPASFQMTAMTFPADLSRQIEDIQHDIDIETNPKCREIGENYRNMLTEMQKKGSQRRFFISFAYEKKSNVFRKADADDAFHELNSIVARLTPILEKMGNVVVDDSDDPMGRNYFPSEILYKVINRNQEKKCRQKIEEVYANYYAKLRGDNFYVAPKEYLAPDSFVFNNPHFAMVNDTYYTFLYITPNGGYNSNVAGAWLNPFINSYAGVDVNIFCQRSNRETEIGKLRRNISHSMVANKDSAINSEAYENSSENIRAASYLKEGLRSGQDFYNMTVMITVSGKTPQEVNYIVEELKNMAIQMDFRLKEYRHQMKEAFFSSLPLGQMNPVLFNKSNINVLTEGVASVYPFVSSELFDSNGIWLGTDRNSSSMTVVDIFDTKKYKNANLFGCGTTGAGKTFTLLLMAIRMRVKHIPVYIIAPEKEHEFKRICEAIGGQFIQIGAGSPNRINIMAISRPDEKAIENEALIDGYGYQKISYLAEKINSLKAFFRSIFPNLSQMQVQLLDEAITETYARFGITMDNDSLIDPEDAEGKRYRKMPVLGDLQETLEADPDCKELAIGIRILTKGSASSFNGQTNVNLDNDFTIIGIEHLKGDMTALGLHMAMDFIWSKAKEDRTKKKALFFDEVWALSSKPESADYLLEIAKIIRAYGGAMLLFTQQMSDLLTAKSSGEDKSLGEKILNNCQSNILLNMTYNDASLTQEVLDLSDDDVNQIINFQRGQALFVANNESTSFSVMASEVEERLITTDRKRLMEIASEEAEKRKEMYRRMNEPEETIEDITDLFITSDQEEITQMLDFDEAVSNRYSREMKQVNDALVLKASKEEIIEMEEAS